MNAVESGLFDALKAIAANSDEDDEWDAVAKLHMNAVTVNLALAKALIEIAKAEGR